MKYQLSFPANRYLCISNNLLCEMIKKKKKKLFNQEDQIESVYRRIRAREVSYGQTLKFSKLWINLGRMLGIWWCSCMVIQCDSMMNEACHIGKSVSHLINCDAEDMVNHCEKILIDLAIVMKMAPIISRATFIILVTFICCEKL